MEKTAIHNHETHTHDSKHEHSHEHNHNHGGKFTLASFFIGIITFVLGLLVERSNELFSTILFQLYVATEGHHIIDEGIGDMIRNSISLKKF